MAYYSAKQRTSDGRWDYTCQNGAGTFPLGYCSGPELAHYSPAEFHTKFHDDGHATAEGAEACHRAYELDCETKFHEHPDEQKKCQVCGAWTMKCAFVGNTFLHRFELCEAHLNRETLETLYK